MGITAVFEGIRAALMAWDRERVAVPACSWEGAILKDG